MEIIFSLPLKIRSTKYNNKNKITHFILYVPENWRGGGGDIKVWFQSKQLRVCDKFYTERQTETSMLHFNVVHTFAVNLIVKWKWLNESVLNMCFTVIHLKCKRSDSFMHKMYSSGLLPIWSSHLKDVYQKFF